MEHLKNEQILYLSAQRQYLEDSMTETPLKYAKIEHRQTNKFNIKYKINGGYDKEAIQQLIETNGVQDISIDKIDILLPDGLDMSKYFEGIQMSDQRFVMRLKKYVASNEMGNNDYARNITSMRTLEGKLLIHPGSLDLQNILPFNTWRETTGRNISKQYRMSVESLETIVANAPKTLLKNIMASIFPESLVKGRAYRLKAEGKWVLED